MQGISTICATATFSLAAGTYNGVVETVENRSNLLISEIVAIATFFVTLLAATVTKTASVNLQKSVNSLRCALVNGFTSVYMLVAAFYYVAIYFKFNAEIDKLVNQLYPYICTCTNDVTSFSSFFGATNTAQFKSC